MKGFEWLHSGYSVICRRTHRPEPIAPPKCLLIYCLTAVLLAGCATSAYHGTDASSASFLQRSQTQQQGHFTVRAAVPDSAETLALTGLDLYEQGIQPVWLEVRNNGATDARLTLWSVDRNYFSPIEVAYMNRKKFSKQGYEDMQHWFYDNGLGRHIPAGESQSGLVFTHLMPGTKGFNLDIFSNRQSTSFTFFLPLPGFVADYSQVEFQTLYSAAEYQQLDEASLEAALESMPCCATDETGQLNGGPFNLVFVGTTLAVRRSLLRGKWLETSVENDVTSRARGNRYRERPPDAIFYQNRDDGDERLQLHLWLAPWRVNNDSVWLGQIYYRYKDRPAVLSLRDIGLLKNSKIVSQLIGESISADIDSAQRFIIQNFWYNHSLLKVGFVSGAGAFSQSEPGVTFDGLAYFTDGERAVLFLSETAVALDDARIIYNDNKNITTGPGDD